MEPTGRLRSLVIGVWFRMGFDPGFAVALVAKHRGVNGVEFGSLALPECATVAVGGQSGGVVVKLFHIPLVLYRIGHRR